MHHPHMPPAPVPDRPVPLVPPASDGRDVVRAVFITLGVLLTPLALLPGVAVLVWGLMLQMSPILLLLLAGGGDIEGNTPYVESVQAGAPATFELGWIILLVGLGIAAIYWAVVFVTLLRPARRRRTGPRSLDPSR